MMKKGKILKRWSLILTIVMFISGCSSAPQTGQPGGPAPAVVDIWHSLQGAEFNTLEKQVQSIEKTHPEVIVKLNYVPEQNFAASAYQAEAGGEGPEMFIASRETIHQLYGQGALAPAAYIDEASFPAALAAFRFSKTEYALPWLTDIPLLYFRTDTATVPADLSELFSANGVSLVSPDTASLSAWWNGQGGRLMNGGKPSLNDAANLAFLQQLLTWRNSALFRIDPSALTAFANGQTPYLIAGASSAKYLTQLNVPWGSIPLSDLLGGQGQSLIGRTLGIANSAIKTTPGTTAAIQTVEKALLTPEVEGAMVEAGQLLPANKSYYERPEAQKGVFPQASIALSKAWVLEGNTYEWKLIPLQDAAWSDVLSGGTAPEEALNNAQEQAGKVLSVKGQS
ncbi:ABC-type sugar transport system, periplasmic component [Desulfosporosinus orientis DSM 765]|uniref:ABC-type sugar transport system, periplasmic component n=1 Tax=Desulfosporosinus orientis (strain ATCC 19365 / DSM 765 / NCIMB 8382 / VKM B-1628 / Singapore I) TaxID=768706 RepID=G7WGB9_DESOD|nr:extracellular solute-binding protein [Desulfosporosinus orientis]AET70851.1 ABC-type sugar transport system, periplasmic component [Desulfosporosinus orientis DSM 765]